MTEPLDIDAPRRLGSESWDRGDPREALIERTAWDEWVVWLPDGEAPHEVALSREQGAYLGTCDCPGYEYHDGPCAHLIAVRRADHANREGLARITDTRGRPVETLAREDVADARADSAVEQAVRADGGERR